MYSNEHKNSQKINGTFQKPKHNCNFLCYSATVKNPVLNELAIMWNKEIFPKIPQRYENQSWGHGIQVALHTWLILYLNLYWLACYPITYQCLPTQIHALYFDFVGEFVCKVLTGIIQVSFFYVNVSYQ